MANRNHNAQTPPKKSPGKAGKPVNHRGVDNPPMPERTANWPGLPGQRQPRGRCGGTKKVKQHPSSEGI
jgi:hypothetical protein